MFNLGFMGALTTTILGSIAWQLVAGQFPIAFLSNPIVYIFLQAALFLEATGICAAAWFFALIQKKICGFQYDEVYIGTAEERAAKGHADDEDAGNLDMGTNVIASTVNRGLTVGWMEGDYTTRRKHILQQIADIREQIKLSVTEEEKAVFEQSLKIELSKLERTNNEQEASSKKLGDLKLDEEAP